MVIRAREHRRGTSAVEFAFVAPIFFLFLFSIFEFGRLLAVRQVSEEAVRAGARYAVVHTNDGAALTANTQAIVNTALGPLKSQYPVAPTIIVYLSSGNGTNIGSPQDAAFGRYIAVQLDGDYKPVLPSFFVLLPGGTGSNVTLGGSSIHITTRSVMASEAN